MKKFLSVLMVILMVLSFSACKKSTDDKAGENPDPVGSEDVAKDFYAKFSTQEAQLYSTVFNPDTNICFKIDIEPSELVALNKQYNDEDQYDVCRKCNLTITVDGTDYFYDEVGIKMKGNTSRRLFCGDSGSIYDLVHFKFDLAETFDGKDYESDYASSIKKTWSSDDEREARKDRTFATMDEFYIKWNKNFDNTYCREIYATRMFRQNGIYAQNITCTQVQIKQNGSMQNYGVWGLYETIDNRFINRNFSVDERGGDLYKASCASLTSSNNLSLKTNKKTSTKESLNNFLQVMNDSSKDITTVLDVNYFTSFEAVNYVLGNPDCIRNNENNYYIYFTPTGKGYVIPYDYDRCLGINKDWNPTGNGMVEVEPFSKKQAANNNDINNPLYKRTILNTNQTDLRVSYANKIKNLVEGDWFTTSYFETNYYNKYKDSYSSVVSTCAIGELPVDRFDFNLNGDDGNSTDGNLSIANYFTAKKSTALEGIKEASNTEDSTMYTLYYDNTDSNWTTPYIYYWGDGDGFIAMSKHSGNIWKVQVSKDIEGALFAGVNSWSNTGDKKQTVNLSKNPNTNEYQVLLKDKATYKTDGLVQRTWSSNDGMQLYKLKIV